MDPLPELDDAAPELADAVAELELREALDVADEELGPEDERPDDDADVELLELLLAAPPEAVTETSVGW